MPQFTKTQERILRVLADGQRHHKTELKEVLRDPEAQPRALIQHISILRKKLRPVGEDIVCEFYQRRIHYRHVRLIGNTI